MDQELNILLSRSRAGDSHAYRLLLEAISVIVKTRVTHLLKRSPDLPHQLAEDVTQETLLAFHAKRDTIDLELGVTAWIMTVCKHKLIDALRLKENRIQQHSRTVLERDLVTEGQSCEIDWSEILNISALSELQKNILLLITHRGLDQKEVSQELQISVSNVKTNFLRAKRKLHFFYSQTPKDK